MAKTTTKNTKKRATKTAKATSSKGPKKFVYFFGNGKADGNRIDEGHARRQGRGPRRDDQRRPAGAGRLHDLDRRLQHLLRQQQQAAGEHRNRNGRAAAQAREGGRRRARLEEEAAARVGPLGREVLDARHDGHHSQPRLERRDRRRPEGVDRQRPLRVSTAIAASSRCSAASSSRFPRRRSSTSSKASKHAKNAKLDTDLDEAALREVVAAYKKRRQGAHQEGLPAGSDGPAARRAERRVPLVEQRAREGIPPHLRHPGFDRHRRQRADDGVRQHRRPVGHRRGLHAQSRDRREGILR